MDGLFHPVLKHGTGYGDREYLPGTKRAATIIVGYCGCLVMLVAMHIILVPDQNSQPPAIGVRQDAGQTFDPAQCEAPPLSCWDGKSNGCDVQTLVTRFTMTFTYVDIGW